MHDYVCVFFRVLCLTWLSQNDRSPRPTPNSPARSIGYEPGPQAKSIHIINMAGQCQRENIYGPKSLAAIWKKDGLVCQAPFRPSPVKSRALPSSVGLG